jgi:glucose-1-phosphate thymidylyltransferase
MRRDDGTARLDTAQEASAAAGVKAMISFGPATFLDYVLSALADAGVEDVCLVIGPEPSAVREHYTAVAPRRVRVAFAVQREPRGTADAVLAAEEFAGGQGFLVINSDNLYPVSALAALADLNEPGVVLFDRGALVARGNIPAERIASFAVCRVSPDGYLEEILEKPDPVDVATLGPDPPVSMNCWRFAPSIFDACRRVSPSRRGELELPAAVGLAIHSGVRFRAVRSSEGVLDLSSRSDVAAVSRRLEGVVANP